MNFTQAVAEVVRKVKRPDLLPDARLEVNAAISFCCLDTNFARDFDEVEVAIAEEYSFNIALTEFPQWRKFVYIRPVGRNCILTPIDVVRAFMNNKERTDVYYVAGNQVNIKLSKTTTALKVGYMLYPPTLTDLAPTHWLLDVAPYMIIDKAAAAVFKNTGNNAEADKHESKFALAYLSAAKDFRLGQNFGR